MNTSLVHRLFFAELVAAGVEYATFVAVELAASMIEDLSRSGRRQEYAEVV